ncbi:MAG: putative multi-sensor signal transduction histidine kinase [Gemmatimonadetes bacterium]|nr:putative multi-sensor signal transduction histidine kinase [Gemmatimonadota bacterium]
MPNVAPEKLRSSTRLAALRATGLLDAPAEQALDRLTRLAARLVGVPIALVSLVDDKRQFFASEVGVGEPWRTERGTDLSHSFCQHVVATSEALVVDDARINALVADNLAIPDLGVIAYAGIPLKDDSGEVLGSFCAIDTAPRHWTPENVGVLEDLAHAAMSEIQLRQASRLLSDRQAFLADMLDHTSELVCATDEQGFIGYANVAMLDCTGYSAEELGTMRAIDLIAEDCWPSFLDAANRVRAGEVVPGLETILLTKSGQRLICKGRGTPVRDQAGNVVGVRVIFRDLTRERQAQRLKDELIALVSHELRTPVGAIRGALKILVPHVAHFEGKPRQLFEMATRNADRLLLLVNDLLDIERLESGSAQLKRAPISAHTLLELSREATQPLADNANITLALEAPDTAVDVDSSRVQQVVVNLVENALKFSPAESTITLRAAPTTLEDGRAAMLLSVSDQGRGIPADKIDRVFERFEQVMPSDASEKGGAGLGLAISRAIVEQHGGKIWVESAPGVGSTFYFTVPLASS